MDPRQRVRPRGVRDSIIRVDTAYAEWQGARASGAGTLGWAAPHDGRMRFALAADSLIGFDSLLLAVTGQTRDTSAERGPSAAAPWGGWTSPEASTRFVPTQRSRCAASSGSGCARPR